MAKTEKHSRHRSAPKDSKKNRKSRSSSNSAPSPLPKRASVGKTSRESGTNDVTLTLVDLTELTGDLTQLANHAVTALDWRIVDAMLPACMKGRSKEDVIQLVTEELEGMSSKRIRSILDGKDLPSSSSESEDDDNDDASDRQSDAENDHAEMVSVTMPSSSRGNSSGLSGGDSQSPPPVEQEPTPPSEDDEPEVDTFSDIDLVEDGDFGHLEALGVVPAKESSTTPPDNSRPDSNITVRVSGPEDGECSD